MNEFQVVCSNRNAHGRILIALFDRNGDEWAERKVRDSKAPWASGSTIEAEGHSARVGGTFVAVAESRVEVFEGSNKWRFKCPSCGRDLAQTPEHFSNIVAAFTGDNRSVFDISEMPS